MIKRFISGAFIKKGDSGSAVLAIQQALNTKGINLRIKEDGVFDSTTLSAIKAFQQSHNLQVDGIVEPVTFAALGITEV